ncbi:MAG: hypothetical protein P8X58_15210 [Syntrophobacterales bacterium]
MASDKEFLRILHLITSLQVGGAQMHLYKTVTRFRPERIASLVVSLAGPGKVGRLLQGQGIPVLDLGMRPGSFSLRPWLALLDCIRRFRPHVLQTYLYQHHRPYRAAVRPVVPGGPADSG